MPGDTVEFSEPRFHSAARAPHDSKPIIEVERVGAPFGFSIEFVAGAESAHRIVMRVEEAGVRESSEIIRKGELLLYRIALPVGREVIVRSGGSRSRDERPGRGARGRCVGRG